MKKQNTPPDEILEVEEEVDENEVSVAYDIASYPSDLTLSVVNEMWANGDIVIPDFQRNFVWSIKQSSLLVESFLIGLPVPQQKDGVQQKVKISSVFRLPDLSNSCPGRGREE